MGGPSGRRAAEKAAASPRGVGMTLETRVASLERRTDHVDDRLGAMDVKLDLLVAASEQQLERIEALETWASAIDAKLDRVDAKLDRIIDLLG